MSVNVVIKSVFDNKGLKQAEKAFDGLGSSVAKLGALVGGGWRAPHVGGPRARGSARFAL